MGETEIVAEALEAQRKCFVIGPIGPEKSEEREHSDRVLRHLVKKVIEVPPFNYEVRRADEIDQPGTITTQIITDIRNAELVVADLTGRNANVFYELAMCHIWQKPTVHLCRDDEKLPFDVEQLRVVFFNLGNPDSVVEAQQRIAKHVQWLEAGNKIETPLQFVEALDLVRTGEDRDERMFDVLSKVVESLSRIGSRVEFIAGWAEVKQRKEQYPASYVLPGTGLGTLYETPSPSKTVSHSLDALLRLAKKPEKE